MNSIAQLASERTSLTLFAPAPSTISFVPLTRNSSPAAPFPTPSKALGTGNRLLRYRRDIRCTKTPFWGTRRIFRNIRCKKQASTVRNMRAVLKKASWGTRRIFRDTRCAEQASPVRKGYSVPETAFSGTEEIFGAGVYFPDLG